MYLKNSNLIFLLQSIQNSRDHINVKFVRTRKKMSELARKRNFLNYQKITKNFVAISSRPETVKLDRAFAIGFTILEKSKYVMYSSYYKILKPHFGNIELIATDTGNTLVFSFFDSQVFEVLENANYQILLYRFLHLCCSK